MLKENFRLATAILTRQYAEFGQWVNRRKSHFLIDQSHADLHDLRIGDTPTDVRDLIDL